jgi:filamentous hemagglutinin
VELLGRINYYNAQWQIFGDWIHIDGTRTIQQSGVLATQPGAIVPGQGMTLSGTVTNDKSRMVAGSSLQVTEPTANNVCADTGGQRSQSGCAGLARCGA